MRKAEILMLLLVPLAATPAAGQERPKLPPGVAAIVHGEEISMGDFRALLVSRFGATEDGQRALDTVVERLVVDAERRRRGLRVSPEEVKAYVKKVERDVQRASSFTRTLDEVLEEKGMAIETFREEARDFLARQKMAAKDLGEAGEVSLAKMGIWMEGLKRRAGILTQGLPSGVWARVGNRDVTDRDLGEELIGSLSGSRLESVLWDLVISRVVAMRLEEAGLTIGERDLERAMDELRQEFREDPRFRDTTFTFDQYVKAVRRLTVEELKVDPLFLAQVGLAKQVRGGLTSVRIREYFDLHRARYGEERTFIHLLVKAAEGDTPFGVGGTTGTRTFEQAKQIIDAIYVKFLRGTPFETLIKQESEDRSKVKRPERPLVVTRETPLPEALKRRVFESPLAEVVGPIRTPYGFHLIQVREIRPARNFEAAKEEVLRDLVREERTRELLKIRQDKQILLRY